MDPKAYENGSHGWYSPGLYKQHRAMLHRILVEQSLLRDKVVLVLASCAPLVVAALRACGCLPLSPGVVWGIAGVTAGSAVALVCTLLSFHASNAAYESLIQEWDNAWRGAVGPSPLASRRFGRAVAGLNAAATTWCAVAVLSLLWLLATSWQGDA